MLAGRLSRSERDAFALMHQSVLPGSLIAALGPTYARRFYDFIDRSDSEFIFIHREAGEIVAGCVLSTEPATLSKRLVRRTPVLPFALLSVARIPWLRIAGSALSSRQAPDAAPCPEVLLIFTKPSVQGRGVGGQLLREAERLVSERGFDRMQVKTLANPDNKALMFYERCGFERTGTVLSLGKRLALFSKSVSLGS